MVKGFNLRAFELRQQILQDIEKAKLPITLVNSVLGRIVQDAQMIEKQSILNESKAYTEYQEKIKQKKKVKKSETN